ncbi:Uncharacterized protein Rs2_20674 [Raphanus sativus]|nr:Uncharacterized protein Rs2_20674 [Raphanus sativus]
MEFKIEAPPPLSSENQSISCALAVESTSLALSSALSTTITSASSSTTSLALTVASTKALEVVNTQAMTSSFALLDTSLASSTTSSTVSPALINMISEPESSIASDSDIIQNASTS